MKKVYFAAPLFSQADFMYNRFLIEKIRSTIKNIDVFVPQEQTSINDKNNFADAKMIAELDANEVIRSDLLIALLDGESIDAGVASEVGIAYHAGIPIIGLYTDSRQLGASNPKKLEALQEIGENQFKYINLFTVGLIKLNGMLVNNTDDLIAAIQNQLNPSSMQ